MAASASARISRIAQPADAGHHVAVRGLAVIEIRRDRRVAVAGEILHPVLDEPVEAGAVHDDDDAGHGAAAGRGVQVDPHRLSIDLNGVPACHRRSSRGQVAWLVGRAYPSAGSWEGAPRMSLTLQQATTIVETALRTGRETSCAPLAVAVLDAGGHLKAFAREDGAGIVRPQIAVGKAWGALGMGFGSRTLARRVADGQAQQQAFFAALNAMSDGRVVPAAGGVLIRDAAGDILGAVGISGDTSDKDEACAVAGITAARLVADPGA